MDHRTTKYVKIQNIYSCHDTLSEQCNFRKSHEMSDRNVHKNHFLICLKVSQKFIGIDLAGRRSFPISFPFSLRFTPSFGKCGRWSCIVSSRAERSLLNWGRLGVSMKEQFQRWSFSLLWIEENRNVQNFTFCWSKKGGKVKPIVLEVPGLKDALQRHKLIWRGAMLCYFVARYLTFLLHCCALITFTVHQLPGSCTQSIPN